MKKKSCTVLLRLDAAESSCTYLLQLELEQLPGEGTKTRPYQNSSPLLSCEVMPCTTVSQDRIVYPLWYSSVGLHCVLCACVEKRKFDIWVFFVFFLLLLPTFRHFFFFQDKQNQFKNISPGGFWSELQSNLLPSVSRSNRQPWLFVIDCSGSWWFGSQQLFFPTNHSSLSYDLLGLVTTSSVFSCFHHIKRVFISYEGRVIGGLVWDLPLCASQGTAVSPLINRSKGVLC